MVSLLKLKVQMVLRFDYLVPSGYDCIGAAD